MKTFLLIAAAILIIVGGVLGFAYIKRKEKKFDTRCNNYFVVSIACLIAAATICVFEIGLVIIELL